MEGPRAHHAALDDDGDGAVPTRSPSGPTSARWSTNSHPVDRRRRPARHRGDADAEVSIKEGGAWTEGQHGGMFRNVRQVTMPPQASDENEYLRHEAEDRERPRRRPGQPRRRRVRHLRQEDVRDGAAGRGSDGGPSDHQTADWGAYPGGGPEPRDGRLRRLERHQGRAGLRRRGALGPHRVRRPDPRLLRSTTRAGRPAPRPSTSSRPCRCRPGARWWTWPWRPR